MALKITPKEISLSIGEKEYLISPTFQAILEIETKSGKGITEILRSISEQAFAFSDIVTIVWAGIKAHAKANKANLKDIPACDLLAEEIAAHGYIKLIEPLTGFLHFIINGSQELESAPNKEETSEGNAEKNA